MAKKVFRKRNYKRTADGSISLGGITYKETGSYPSGGGSGISYGGCVTEVKGHTVTITYDSSSAFWWGMKHSTSQYIPIEDGTATITFDDDEGMVVFGRGDYMAEMIGYVKF